MRMTDSGVFRSCETLATKSDLSCAISASRRMSRQVRTRPTTITARSTPNAAVKMATCRRTVCRVDGHAPARQALAEADRQDTLGPLEGAAAVDRAAAVVDHSYDGRRLEPAESRLEDFPSPRDGRRVARST